LTPLKCSDCRAHYPFKLFDIITLQQPFFSFTLNELITLIARDQLEFAVAELSTFENGKVTQTLNDALAAAIAGEKTATADRILKPYR
jgi:hypothetical protein